VPASRILRYKATNETIKKKTQGEEEERVCLHPQIRTSGREARYSNRQWKKNEKEGFAQRSQQRGLLGEKGEEMKNFGTLRVQF